MGDRYLRKLLIVDMTAVIRSARRTKAPAFAWVNALLERRPARLISVALANKAARIAWAILIPRRDIGRRRWRQPHEKRRLWLTRSGTWPNAITASRTSFSKRAGYPQPKPTNRTRRLRPAGLFCRNVGIASR
jgi:hypothetical protein